MVTWVHFEGGVPLSTDQDPQEQVAKYLHEGKYDRKERLSPGRYNITPSVWTTHVYEYHLEVKTGNSAVCTMVPRFSDSQSIVVAPSSEAGVLERGGRIIRIPEDRDVLIIAGPKAGESNAFYLYEVILVIP